MEIKTININGIEVELLNSDLSPQKPNNVESKIEPVKILTCQMGDAD